MRRLDLWIAALAAVAVHAAVLLAAPAPTRDGPAPAHRGAALAVRLVPAPPAAAAPEPRPIEPRVARAAPAPHPQTEPARPAARKAQPSARRDPAPAPQVARAVSAPAPPSPAGGRRPDPGIQTPLLHQDLVRPEYPRLSRRRGEEGTVRVRVSIGEEGVVDEIEVAGSSGHRRLDRAAYRAVRDAATRPEFVALAARDAPLPHDEEIEIEFRLEDAQR